MNRWYNVSQIDHRTLQEMPDVNAINSYLQKRLARSGFVEVRAVDAAEWLDDAGLLKDSLSRPGLPLRNLLRAGKIVGQEQRPNKRNGRWYIRRLG